MRQATPLDVVAKLPQLLGYRHVAAFAARQGCFRFIDREQDFQRSR